MRRRRSCHSRRTLHHSLLTRVLHRWLDGTALRQRALFSQESGQRRDGHRPPRDAEHRRRRQGGAARIPRHRRTAGGGEPYRPGGSLPAPRPGARIRKRSCDRAGDRPRSVAAMSWRGHCSGARRCSSVPSDVQVDHSCLCSCEPACLLTWASIASHGPRNSTKGQVNPRFRFGTSITGGACNNGYDSLLMDHDLRVRDPKVALGSASNVQIHCGADTARNSDSRMKP